MEGKQRRTRRESTEEFKRDAVNVICTTGRPIAQISRELGIYDSTLGNWSAKTASTVARLRDSH